MAIMTVHRGKPLPVSSNRGRLIIPASVLASTKTALMRFRGIDWRHEGLVYWLGRRCDSDALVMTAYVPDSDHGPQHVFVSEGEVGKMSRRARSFGLVMVAQVHSHPGYDTRHSDGDDKLILMPFEGLFSLVVAHYGEGSPLPNEGAGLHQYQDKRWVQIHPASTDAMIVVPDLLSVQI
jgi:proteasome lid subunit RPN8/RPN11